MNSCSFGEEMQKHVEIEKRKDELEALRRWMAEQRHLPLLEKADLVMFWHRNEYDLNATKKNVERYFWMRTNMPEFFADRDPLSLSLKETFETVSVIMLPNRTPDGYYVVLLRLLNPNPNRYNFCQAVKYLNMIVDIHAYLEGTSNGYLYVCDVKGTRPKHLDNLPNRNVTRFFDYMNKGAHFRWKGLHYINSSSRGGFVNDYIKRKIIDIQLQRNVYLHENMISLSKTVPLELLPNEMGGAAGYVNEIQQTQIKQMKEYSAWYQVEERLRINKDVLAMGENEINELYKIGD